MFISFEDRPSDSPFVERVWRSRSERSDTFSSIAACHWEMVVSKVGNDISLTVRGPETRATEVECPGEGEWFCVRFRLGTYLTLFPPGELRDRNDIVLPNAAQRSFWLNGSAWEYPNFENAETFVNRLVHRGLVAVDPLVTAVIEGQAHELSTRTAQRRFLRTTGMTLSTIGQIERARRATVKLREGRTILDVAYDEGYFDQAHLTRSLKYFVGQTPGQIISADRQLSFLYNTGPA
jgi:hypothetical protein